MSTISIHIIDDDKDLLLAIDAYLGEMDFDVNTFIKWDTAFEVMKKYKPDIILLDLLNSKDGLDGSGVCQKLKECPYMKKYPFFVFFWFCKNRKRRC